MKYNLLFIFFISLLAVQPITAQAQFEGKIVFSSTTMAENGTEDNPDNFTLYVADNRILLKGENSYDMAESIETEGILIRLDEEDFVLFTEDDVALSISRKDIDAMMDMFGKNNNGADDISDIDASVDYERTGQQRTINGYDAELFVFRDEENSGNYAEVWLTKDVEIQWGMLANSWEGVTDEISKEGFPLKLMSEEKYFPLLIESYENDTLTNRFEASEIEETSEARNFVQIPSGMKVMNFQQYLFQQFENR